MTTSLDDAEFRAHALRDAVDGLRERDPDASAAVPFVPWQRVVFLAIAALMIAGFVFAVVPTLIVVIALCTIAYTATVIDRVIVFRRGLRADAILRVSDERARAVPDSELPSYTILLPAYDEPKVVHNLVRGMAALDYPRDKLQILLLLEGDDEVTISAMRDSAVANSELGDFVTTLLVPPADPRTKPKACNFGLHYATGEIVTIYDAEDTPDPLQLRRVAVAFAELPETVACLQAKLGFYNDRQNMLTRWFTVEYGVLFSFLLPGLMASNSPIPLGGTSNHIRRTLFDKIGAWDPFNVTEDADLGVRIAARGYRTMVIDSTTIEEANIDAINWIRQRSRWYKGYLQTWLVHTRHPVRLWRTLGPVGFIRFTVLLAGTPLIAALNIVFWSLTWTWLLGRPDVMHAVFLPPIYFPSLFCLILGNAITIYINVIGCRENHQEHLALAGFLVPAYWLLMGIAAVKACWQLLVNPSYWEKTQHNLGEPES
ncbi:glycosyltransferase [Aldersonia sp. NBC_00410]|uniref:glycosyltransferase family 2 protein n=1 Tax=Aldersonia sp. NBC_00410 TaxID=2975954 RepID=UPI002257FC79|nr:glycosyltransferase family 2 protein [Aldersonia sp. NBC_00410]MCX5042042.1 glycosyltransferase [Aldersonia sp. NBC_00410]